MNINQDLFLWDCLSEKNLAQRKYFKTGCVGADREDKICDLKKTKRNKKTAMQKKIDKQIAVFEDSFSYHNMLVFTSGKYKNTNIKQQKKIINNNKEIIIKGVADIISPVKFTYGDKEYNFDAAIIDLQITKNINNLYGEICWATPQHMNHDYAYFLSVIFDLPFVYWIFDYKNNINRMMPKINHITMKNYPEKQKEKIKNDYEKLLFKLKKIQKNLYNKK